MASSNSHIIFCFCNFIVAILLVSGFQSSSQDDTTNILDHDMSKRKQAQGNSKATQFHKGMNDTSTVEVLGDINQANKSEAYSNVSCVQYQESIYFKESHHQETSFKFENVDRASANGTIDRKMNTHVTSEEMNTFSVSSNISTIEILREVNQDNKSEAYNNVARFQHHESTNRKQSLRQDTSFKCENVEGASANITIDTKMYLAKSRKETNDNNFEKSDVKEEDELRKRIEDFIEKINKGWRAEKLGICYQSQWTV
ncbi:hypothetical protein KY285_000293 [Solanum tuberosum]|nr:hypothetical protein KY284_000332 [Solanum tuberosum]KAH0764422.1 hypothetical protein KY285_000293 [Solanum tuberosum]